MTQEEYIEKLKSVCDTKDSETAHIESDDLLCDALRELGWDDLVDEFENQSVKFWYA